jgi:hypothetical protein
MGYNTYMYNQQALLLAEKRLASGRSLTLQECGGLTESYVNVFGIPGC